LPTAPDLRGLRLASEGLYDLLVKGGRLMDPSQGINEKKDVAISRGKVVQVASSISASKSRRVLDASGKIVSPGFVDLHTHVAHDVVRLSIDPEKVCLPYGSTTAVDAGSTGELNFRTFKRYVIDRCQTRILAFVNVESLGMLEFTADPPNYTDQKWPSLISAVDDTFAPLFANRKNLVAVLRRNKKTVVGIKWAHHGLPLLEIARSVADQVGCRIMAENVLVPDSVKYLKRGDIITHLYLPSTTRDGGPGDGLRPNGSKHVLPEFFEARKRGVLLDIGHGKGSFGWDEAIAAMKEGLPPDTISTDLWIGNADGPVYNMPTTMSKLLHLGMSLEKVIEASTSTPASAVGMRGKLGTLKPGAVADIALFKVVEGKHPLIDVRGKRKIADRLITVTDVVKGGKVVKTF
jgi:dihydroorotase